MKSETSKKIIQKVIKEEVKKTGIPITILPLTKTENIIHIIASEIENKRNDSSITITNLLKNIKNSLMGISDKVGDYDYLNDIIKIFLSEIEKESPTKPLYLWELLTTTYHEYNHKLLWSKEQTEKNLTNFTLILENLICEITDLYEKNHHDDFYEEIIANVYSVEKASQFLKRYPHIYEKLKGYIENDKLKYQIQLINHDIEQFINYLNKIIKNKDQKEKLFQSFYPYKIIEIFYNRDGTFKSLATLSKDMEWTSLETEVQYTIISSKSYLKELNYNSLSLEELVFILESLNYSYQKELQRTQQNKELEKQIKHFNQHLLGCKKFLWVKLTNCGVLNLQ